MTVEIRELVIKTTVTDKTPAGNETKGIDRTTTQGLVERCVAEVLQILKREKER